MTRTISPKPFLPCPQDNVGFSAITLPLRDTPLNSPGGAAKVGALGLSVLLVAGHMCADES